MKKRLLSMLMAVLMIASLVPAVAMADAGHDHHDVLTVNITADAAKKQPGIKLTYCNTCANDGNDNTEPVVVAGTVTAFAELKDICDVHKSTKTVVLQEGTCDKPEITVTYCSKCGYGIDSNGNATTKNAFDIDDSMVGEHVYTQFKVTKAPTCELPGWGYTTCDKCGVPAFVYNGGDVNDEAEDHAEYSALAYLYSNEEAAASVKTTTAAKIAAMFNATNPGHDNNDKLVVATKDVYTDQWAEVINKDGKSVGKVVSVLTYEAAVAPTHAQTVNGNVTIDSNGDIVKNTIATRTPEKSYLNPLATGLGKTGTEYCPDCGEVITESNRTDTKVQPLNEQHDMRLDDVGYNPYMDKDGNKHDGVTDTWYCKTCKKSFGGEKIPYASYFKTNLTETEFAALDGTYGYLLGEEVVVGAKAATCQDKGYTGDTYKVIKGEDGLEWSKVVGGETTSAIAHTWKHIESKDATCTEPGWTCNNYYVCTNSWKDAAGKTVYCTESKGTVKVNYDTAEEEYVESDIIAATCKNPGLAVEVCADCGNLVGVKEQGFNIEDYVDEHVYAVDIAPHTAAAELKGVKEATCTEEGYTGDTVCKWCDKVLEAGKTIEKKAHTPEEVAAVAATCTETGLTAGSKCSVCGEVLTAQEVVPALGHKFENGVCTVCGEKDPNYVEPVAPEFKDADSIKDYAKDAVAWAAKEGVVKGDDQGNFNPTANITRQDFVTMLWRLKGETASDKELTFGDKADIKDYAQTAVAWAVENGYITGRDNGNFDPAAKITRAEIVAILNRVADNAKAEKAASFTDIGSHWAKDAIAWAAEAGIVNGVGNDLFAPNDNATRQDTVVMLYKFVNLK